MSTNKKTQVLFLIEKSDDQTSNQVFAFFPNDKYSTTNDGLFWCYSQIDQHSSCHIEHANHCKEATPEQYADLKSELESIDYDLEVVTRTNKRHNTTTIPIYHILTVKFIGPGLFLNSRIKIISERFKTSKTFEYGDQGNTLEQAEVWLMEHGFNIIGHGEGKAHMYVITDTFKSLK